MNIRVLPLVLGLVTAFGLTSCIQSHTVVSVNKDGTATIEEKTMLGGIMAQMMAGLGNAFAGEDDKNAGANPLMDRPAYEARARKMGEGVTLTKFEEAKDDKGGIGVTAVFAVADINKLRLSMNADVPASLKGMAPEIDKTLEDAGEEEKPVTFSLADGKLTIHLPQPETDPAAAKANEELKGLEPELQLGPEEKQQMEMAKMMLQDMAMSLVVRAGDGIAKTDATHSTGDDVILFSMKFSEILKDPAAFNKLALMGEELQDEDKALEAVKKLPGVKVETKEKVTVTFK